ncbi:MAG: phospho-N-acetylmuramoyl-pentapeptide-transferase [Phascolarctobacterium sp.]|nr:phospho-N-acetylmuramoyl-pentapeptide-transferase [Phascolarctobacterium sp.]
MFFLSGIFITAFIVSASVGPVLINFLYKLGFGQSIRECGPENHIKKSGTPTMGGFMILTGIVAALLFWNDFTSAVIIALILTLGYATIGFIDDYIKVVMKRNLGLTAAQKVIMQVLLAGIYLYYVDPEKIIWLPGLNIEIDLGYGYYILVFLLLVGTTNAVNLTDGLDGLVACVSLPVTFVFAVIAYTAGHMDLSGYALTIAGSCLGFLIYNHYPARIFMGDTGSLALGGGIAALALLTKTELLLILLGGIYVAEAASVIIQVAYFRYSGGKRIFRMSPLHHHFELGGWREPKVVGSFAAASCFFSMLALGLWFLK